MVGFSLGKKKTRSRRNNLRQAVTQKPRPLNSCGLCNNRKQPTPRPDPLHARYPMLTRRRLLKAAHVLLPPMMIMTPLPPQKARPAPPPSNSSTLS